MMNLAIQVVVCASRDRTDGGGRESRSENRKRCQSK